MTDRARCRQIALDAVKLAEAKLKDHGELQVSTKGDRDYVSNLDFEVEHLVRQYLADVTPEIAFVGEEEGGEHNHSRPWWCLDPIDGTVNFVHGSPLFAVSLALIEQGRPTVGVVAMPAMSMTYDASLGDGARRDDVAIEASNTTDLNSAVVAMGDYAVGEQSAEENKARIALTKGLANTALRVRMHGSAAIDLAWLADGRVDAAIIVSSNPWDVAAGVIIAQEAGAEVTDLHGKAYEARRSGVVAAHRATRKSLIGLAEAASQYG